MSHELRTPVNAILGFVELLDLGLAGPLTETQRDHLTRIGKSGAHLRELINDLLDLGRIEAGQLKFRLEHVPVLAILHNAKEMVTSMFESKQLTLKWPSVDRHLSVYADPARVQQIVINVLTNAYKYTDAGGRVTIECGGPAVGSEEREPTDGETGTAMVSVRISDTGNGIAPEHLHIDLRAVRPARPSRCAGEQARSGLGPPHRPHARARDGRRSNRRERGGTRQQLYVDASGPGEQRGERRGRASSSASPGRVTVGVPTITDDRQRGSRRASSCRSRCSD